MTDEEKAEELTTKQFDLDTDKVRYFCNLYKNDYHEVHTFYNGVLKGIAEGKPKWHDLRKNPDDLPTESKEYWCKLKSGHYDFRIYYIDSLFYKSHWEELGIIAWCELPKFKE